MSSLDNTSAEIEESEKLLALATIPSIKTLLQSHINKLKKDIENKLKKEEENKKLAEKKTQETLNTNSKRPAPNCIIIII